MPLPSSGAISLNEVNVELGLAGTTTISLNQESVRALFQVASGQISMSDGYGKSSGSVGVVTALSESPAYRCANAVSFNQQISWYIGQGTGNISVTLEYAAWNNCEVKSTVFLGTTTSGNWINVTARNYIKNNTNTTYRLVMENSIGTSYSPTIGVIFQECNQYSYCSLYDDCTDNGSLGCYPTDISPSCAEVCGCEPCSYDCNCDGEPGYGPQCSCDSPCECDDPESPNYPCEHSQVDCGPPVCYCPCGYRCLTGQRRTCDQVLDYSFPAGNNWSSCS